MTNAFKTMQDLLHQTQGTRMLCITHYHHPDGTRCHYIVAEIGENAVIQYRFEILNGDSYTNVLISVHLELNSLQDEFILWKKSIEKYSPYAILTFYAC